MHVPEPGRQWSRRDPADLGFDPRALQEAVDFASDHETDLDRDIPAVLQTDPINDHPDNEIVGPTRARTGVNGVIVRDGLIAAEWGDIHRVDMTFSVAKSYLSTMAGLAFDRGMIGDLDEPVSCSVDDEVFESERNRKITWRMLLQQTSEWEGVLWGKRDLADRRMGRDRELNEPGTFWEYNDVRVNLLAYAVLKLWRKPLPMVLRDEIMDPIGATATWEWHGYDTSWVKINGMKMQSVSGGGHWGGGVWAGSLDHARFGQLFTAGGYWGDRRIISSEWIEAMIEPCPLNESYGFMWWVNQNQERFPSAPATSYFAIGKGTNIIWIDPDLRLTAVVRWIDRDAVDGFCARVVDAIEGSSE
ncbi:MAG: serine hydrolase domain-containing protein [Chloroflexota bacterium]